MNGNIKGRIVRPEAEKSRLILPRVGQIKIGMKNANGSRKAWIISYQRESMPGYLRKHTAKSRKQYKLFSRTTTRQKYVTSVTNTGTTTGD